MEEVQLEEFIMNELPSDGEWWSDGYIAFKDLAKRLDELDMPLVEIKSQLQAIYSAVSAEYSS